MLKPHIKLSSIVLYFLSFRELREDDPKRDRDRRRRRSKSRDRRDRSRSKDRKRRSRSRDKERGERDGKRSRSKDKNRRRRSRSRDRAEKRKSRSRSKDRRRSRTPPRLRLGPRRRSSRSPQKDDAPLSPEERDARTVFCMQLSQRVRARDLEDFFSSVGKVRDVRMITCNKTRRFKGIAYVEFGEIDSVGLVGSQLVKLCM